MRNVHRRVERPVAWGVEGIVGEVVAAEALPTRTYRTCIPERPSRVCRSSRDVGSVGLKEVDVVLRACVGCTPQEGEDYHDSGSARKEPA